MGVLSQRDNALPTYKAPIVEKGFKQEGVNLDEIFSPIVNMIMLRVVLALIAKKNLYLFQMDVKIVFSHGDIDEEIYMEQVKAYEMQGKCICYENSRKGFLMICIVEISEATCYTYTPKNNHNFL